MPAAPTQTGVDAGVVKQNEESFELRVTDVKALTPANLLALAKDLGIEAAISMRKSDLVLAIGKLLDCDEITQRAEGCLEVHEDGFGFLRAPEHNYLPCPYDIYVSPSQIRRFNLRKGDTVFGRVRPPKDQERYYALLAVEEINGVTSDDTSDKPFFDNLTPLYPQEQLKLEGDADQLSTRVLDLFSPIGKGQRALIVAPPRAGKTMLMQAIANAITQNHPETVLMVLLIDERPEEVTDMTRSVDGLVLASTFDEPAERHIAVAEMVLERAKRLVEKGEDVVILLDSITRLARAYNSVVPPSGKILSGGVDSNALHKPKRFFGAARNIEDGGSLTIIATALVDTGSRMDEVIFEEFKGTGNCELHLDRKLMEKRIFPCLDLHKSGTRKEELLLEPPVLSRIYLLRQHFLTGLNTVDAMTFVHDQLRKTVSNTEFLDSMSQ
ncbi:MAG: transcription termination factor Rho [Bradymonadia bacterium]|jgi:transcription termination factor Rho